MLTRIAGNCFWMALLLPGGFAPTALRASPRALSRLDSVGKPPESWRHRLRRLYAATATRRPLETPC
jgi:hypothetical protein